MLSYERIKAIEESLGPQAEPLIAEFQEIHRELDSRIEQQRTEIKKDLFVELATKEDIARLEGKIETEVGKIEGRFETEVAKLEGKLLRIEVFMKVLIGLAILGIAFFSPNAAELIRLLK